MSVLFFHCSKHGLRNGDFCGACRTEANASAAEKEFKRDFPEVAVAVAEMIRREINAKKQIAVTQDWYACAMHGIQPAGQCCCEPLSFDEARKMLRAKEEPNSGWTAYEKLSKEFVVLAQKEKDMRAAVVDKDNQIKQLQFIGDLRFHKLVKIQEVINNG